MLSMMYTINRVPRSPSEVTLTCNKCSHSLRVNQFDDRLGSCRTQAARAIAETCTHRALPRTDSYAYTSDHGTMALS
jgi:hypothetical protein